MNNIYITFWCKSTSSIISQDSAYFAIKSGSRRDRKISLVGSEARRSFLFDDRLRSMFVFLFPQCRMRPQARAYWQSSVRILEIHFLLSYWRKRIFLPVLQLSCWPDSEYRTDEGHLYRTVCNLHVGRVFEGVLTDPAVCQEADEVDWGWPVISVPVSIRPSRDVSVLVHRRSPGAFSSFPARVTIRVEGNQWLGSLRQVSPQSVRHCRQPIHCSSRYFLGCSFNTAMLQWVDFTQLFAVPTRWYAFVVVVVRMWRSSHFLHEVLLFHRVFNN